jgi:WG containing repeat
MKQILFVLLAFVNFANGYSQKLIIFEKGLYKTGLKDSSGKVVVKPTYTGILDNKTHFVLYKNTQGSTVMSYDGKVLIPPKYRELEITLNKKYYKATGFDSEYKLAKGYVDLQGNEVVPVKYTDIDDYYGNEYLIVRNKYNWYGVISTGKKEGTISDFKEIVPPIHIHLKMRKLEDGRLAILVEDIYRKKAVLDGEGRTVTDYVNWTIVPVFFSTETLTVVNNETNKWGLADPFLKILLPLEYETIFHYEADKHNYYITYKNNKMGMVDKKGKVFLENMYDIIYNDEHASVIALKLNGKWGVKDFKGNQLLPFIYDSLGKCNGYYVDLKKGNQWKTIDAYTGKAQSNDQSYQNTADLFLPLQKKIVLAVDQFAEEHAAIRNTRFTTEYELQKRFTNLLNTKVSDLKADIVKARGLLTNFLNTHPSISTKDKTEINNVILELTNTWNLLDKAKNYKDIVFATKKETVGGVIDEILSKYDK